MPESESGIVFHKSKKLNVIIDEILPTVRSVIMKDDRENFSSFHKLQGIVKEENLWIPIIYRLINQIEMDDPLGASVIMIFLYETPLPTMEQIDMLNEKILLDNKVGFIYLGEIFQRHYNLLPPYN